MSIKVGKGHSSAIATNTGNNITETQVQTINLVKSESDVANSVNNNINSNFVTLEELIRNVKDALGTIKDTVIALKELEDKDLGQIVTDLDVIDTKTIIQELTKLHESVNNLGDTLSIGLSSENKSVPFTPVNPVDMPDYSKKNSKQVDKKAYGNTKLDPSILGDGEGNNEGEELVVHKDGSTELIGGKGYTLVPNLSEDDTVVSHEDTKKILNQGGIQKVSKYADGNKKVKIYAKSDPTVENGLQGDYENAYNYIHNVLKRDDVDVRNIFDGTITSDDYVLGTELTIPNALANGAKRIPGGKDRAETLSNFETWADHIEVKAKSSDIQTTENDNTKPDTPTTKTTDNYNKTSSGNVPTDTPKDYTKLEDTAYRKQLNNDINDIENKYTNQLENDASNSDLLNTEIDLEKKKVLLNQDGIKQLEEKKKLEGLTKDDLAKINEKQISLNKEMQESQKKINDLAKQEVDSVVLINNAKEKQLETNIKLIGSTNTKDELENDKRKIEILKEESKEYENQQKALENLQDQNKVYLNDLQGFSSDKLSTEENTQLKDLILKQNKDGYLESDDQSKLKSLETKLTKLDPDKALSLQKIIDLLTNIRDKKTDVEINVRNSQDTNAATEYEIAQQVIENQKKLDEAQFEQLKKDKAKEYFNITPDEFNQYKINESAKIQEKLKESQDLLNTDPNNLYYQDEVLAKTKELSNIQNENYANIKDWEDEFTKVHQARVEDLEKENELEEEKGQRLQNQCDLLSLQKQLVEALNQKNVRQMVKDKNGNWQYQYVADQTKVDDLNKQINDKMKDNDKWEKEQKINKEKEYENDLINVQKNAYDKLIKDQQDILNDKYKDMNYLTEDYLKQIKIQCGNNDVLIQQALGIALSNTQKDLTGFITATDGKIVEMHDLIQTLVNETIKALNDTNKNENKDKKDTTITTPSIYGGMVTNSQSKVDEYKKATQDLREKALNDILNGNSQNLSNYHNQAENLADKYGVKLDTGGYTGDWGTKEGKLAWLHQKELVLKEDDTKNVLATVKYADNLNKNLLDKFNLKDFQLKTSIPKINVQIPSDIVARNNNESKPIQQQITIQKLEFPGVKNGNDVVETLRRLPQYILQENRKQ